MNGWVDKHTNTRTHIGRVITLDIIAFNVYIGKCLPSATSINVSVIKAFSLVCVYVCVCVKVSKWKDGNFSLNRLENSLNKFFSFRMEKRMEREKENKIR